MDNKISNYECSKSKENIFIDVSKWKEEYLSKKSVSCKDRFQTINHPLVTSGYAYWVDDNTICLKDK